MKKFDPATAINAVQQLSAERGVNPSINDSATFTFPKGQLMTDTFHGETEGYYLYSRHWNPSNFSLCQALAAMENTEAAWVTGSGMAAITCTLLNCVKKGDHIVASMTVYGGTFAFLNNWIKRYGVDVTFVDTTNLAQVKAACKKNTKVIYTETMSNPLLRISNIGELRKIADKYGAKLIVDNTFTPMIFSPYRLGAHVVVYSMTKFINGKNDCVAGAICADAEFINSLINVNDGTAMLLGPVLDSYRATSILKNLYTLHIRMKQHSANAMYLAEKFNSIGIKANYTGLPTHKDHKLMKEQMNPQFGFGGMIAIDLKTAEKANRFMEAMQKEGIGYLAVSLGYFRTLFSCSGKSTSSEVPEEYQKEMGMSEGLVRFSVGLDNDIEDTFARMHKILKKEGFVKK
ncbi:MAG: aminotransferase class I/II-fold pyridoxal phosphate-dependent enzyme [Bacteroidales bacterium]|nr:aminotransferase class I/II-fold pyridoxal phosphate-dependent enzyme [Bacteroidales bacterium]MBR4453863.1 aminotransferase class I/II-fold pyridoxal phosphate-dependent enzyme [Bacteroidales bacterium]MCR5555876.1 aminotransferase class I/II-fold pyridoxal phosphate-dependent enzyme [Bacteroidales bacterium]